MGGKSQEGGGKTSRFEVETTDSLNGVDIRLVTSESLNRFPSPNIPNLSRGIARSRHKDVLIWPERQAEQKKAKWGRVSSQMVNLDARSIESDSNLESTHLITSPV